MGFALLILVGVLVLGLAALFVALLISRTTRGIALIMAGSLLGLFSLLCIFGFLASFEPSGSALAFRTGYAIAFFTSLGLGFACLILGVKFMNRS